MGFTGRSHHGYWEIRKQLSRLSVRGETSHLTLPCVVTSTRNHLFFASVINNFLYLHNCIKHIILSILVIWATCRPVTLTSHLITTIERIVLGDLHILNLQQMAYLLGSRWMPSSTWSFTWSPPGSTVKVKFSLFLLLQCNTTFITIQQSLLWEKMEETGPTLWLGSRLHLLRRLRAKSQHAGPYSRLSMTLWWPLHCVRPSCAAWGSGGIDKDRRWLNKLVRRGSRCGLSTGLHSGGRAADRFWPS